MRFSNTWFRLVLLLLLYPYVAISQQNYSISGKVTDSTTGEDLIGVTVLALEPWAGTMTNNYGFYSISLPEGDYTLRYSYMGYNAIEHQVQLHENLVINMEINPTTIALNEVIITAEKRNRNISSAEMGVEKINMRDIENIPVIFGEKDILKTIQLLPGISSSGEGSTGFNVRGGSMDQNLILLDEANVFSASHLMGFFSVFNADAIKDVTVYKGGIPAKYGTRASSVLDISMINGNNKKFSVSGGISLISTRLTIQGPIIKDKMSFVVSGRRTYADLIAKAILPEDIFSKDIRLYFYDLNAKLNYTLNEKNRLFISGYFGQDVFGYETEVGTDWGNKTGTLRWNHIFNDRLFSNTSIIFSEYNYGFTLKQNDLKLGSGVRDFTIKEDMSLYINPENTLKFGAVATNYKFMPGELTTDEDTNFELVLEERRAWSSGLYIQNDQIINNWISSNYGLRLSMFNQTGPGWIFGYGSGNQPVDSSYYESGEIVQTYFGIEPRLSVNFMVNDQNAVKFSYNRMAQYLHLLTNSTSGSPTDVWMPSSNNLKPLYVDQVSAGFFKNLNDNLIETSLEIYYKRFTNTVDYEDGTDIMLNKHVESQILTGIGRSVGIELYAKKKYGDFTGWISYTISRTENKIEGINDFTWYPVKYDKSHDISIVASYKFGPQLSISAVWTYATGNAITFPSGKYVLDGMVVPYYTDRNSYRMPEYHRADLSITLKNKEHKKHDSTWDLSIYNLYNRHNAYLINFDESPDNPDVTQATRLSLFGIVPSISYNFKF